MTVLSSQLNNKLSKMNGKTIYVPSYIFGLGLLFLSFSSISFTLDKNKEVSFFKKRITFLKIKIYEKVEGNLAFTGMGSGCATLLANLNAIGTVPDPTIAYVDNNPPFGCGSETMYPSPLVSAEQSGSFATAFCVPTPLPYRGLDESFQVVVGGDLIIPSTGGAEIEGRAAIGGNIQVNRTPYGIAESGGGTYVIGAAGDAVGVSGTINGTGALSLGANNSGATYNIVSGGANTATLNNGTKIQNSASLPLDVSAFMTEVSCLSTDLSNATPTGSFNTSNEFFQGSNNATLEIITVDGADLNPATAFNSGYYDIDYGATLVVNVSGTSVDLNYTVRAGRVDDPTFTAFGGGPLIYKVIWNFYEATSITLHTNFQGTIIAPLANMDIKGNYNGRIYIGGDLTHSGSGSEIHNYPFTGNLSSFCNAAISTCNLAITRSYADNCTGSDALGYSADWNIGISVTNAPDNSISYQRNSETVLTHPLTGTTDTVTIAGIPADGGAYDTIKVWFTNETTCADTIILKRPLPCPANVAGSTQPADVCQSVANTAIAGTVFEDWNYDGVMNQSDTVGIAGVQVYIYDDCNNVIDTTYTDANGNYQFTLLTTGTTYRIEFNLPESVACWAKPTQVGVDNGTTIQFVQPGNCASLGLAAPSAYCNTNPDVYLTCYVVGDPLSGDLAYDTLDALIGFPYNSNNNTKTGMFEAAVAKDIGSTWGLALQRSSKTVFTSSVLKRHVGLGTIDGTNTTTGGIYGIDVSNPASPSPIKWIDVNTIGINTGADPRDGSTANSVANVPTSPSFDAATFDLTGKIGIGDLDIQDDNTLWFINLNDRSLYGIKNVNPTVTPTASDVLGPYPVPNPGCGSGSNDIRPWGVEVHKGKVYIGAVCSGETSQDSLDLHAWVFEFDPNAASAGMHAFFDFDINYERGRVKYWNLNASSDLGDWRAWLKETEYVTGTEAYMQPILSDIEFDNDGSMILGFIDRWGLQVERGNYRPDLTGMDTNLENQEFISAGDILRACFVNGTYVFEGGTGCNYNALDKNGPGAHEYYQDDWGGNHALEFSESTQGALLFLPGQTEVMVNQFDPYAANHEGGVRTLNNTTGSVVNKFLVYDTNVPGNFGKGQGLGDFDALCDPAPLEIGNYVWLDIDANGIQNACEPALDSVIVTLYNTACEIIAIDTTDSKGEYYFNETKLREYTAQTDSILSPNTTYYVVITDAVGGAWTTADSTLTIGTNNYNLTINNQGSNDLIDSDATKGTATSACNSVTDGFAFATAITGDAGCVNHSFDIGFRTIATCAEINQLITNRIICSGDLVDTLAITTTFTNPDSIAFVYFDSIQTVATSIYTNGKGLDTLQINNDNDTVRLTNVSGFTNTSTITDTFYVYAIAHPTPSDNTCRPYEEVLVIVNPLPSVSAFAIQPSCDNGLVQTDGYLQISAFTNTDRFNWVVGSNYIADGGDPDYADAMTIGALPYQFNMGIANPIDSQNYTIRAFNGTTGCFQDYTITMNQQDCSVGCNCTENIYLNETTTGGSVHKYEINTDGSLSEIGSPWYDNVAAGDQLTSPHGLASDLNGFLYIGESNTGGEIRRFTCDGEILPEATFGITTAGQFNIGSIGNTLYVGERDFAGIVAYDLCTGAEVSRLQFCENTGNLAGNWGFFIDPITEKMYATNSQTPWVANRVWSFDESQFTADGLPCISNIDTIRNDANSPLRDARFMGITTDTAENIYIVVDDDTNYSGSPSYVLKYGPAPFHPFIAISSLDSLADGTGFNDAHAIVYSETSDRIYVSTNSAFDDCVAIFDTDLNYLGAAVPSPGDGSQAKGMTILKECCPTNNNVTIDTTLCANSLNDSLFLQELISCNGIICEGTWKAGDANVGLTYDSCNHTIKITALNACGSFTLESDGVGGNPKCGAFKITINIGVGNITAPVVAGNQTVCNGDDPAVFTTTTAASGSNTITYQWQSTTDTLSTYTNIPSATNATYDPPTGITDTTYYRVIAAIAGGCSSGNCQDTSNVIIVTVEDCFCPSLNLALDQDTICGGQTVNINLSSEHNANEIAIYVSNTKYDTAQIYAGNATLWKDTLTDSGIVINEVFFANSGSTDTLELLNAGTTTIDVSTYFLCHRFSYGALNTLTLISGNLTTFAPGEKVVLSGFNLDGSASDVGIYTNNSDFNNASNMVDFMQYGSGGNGRESVANTKGIWTTGDFVNVGAYAANSSISYDCYGDNSSDWAEDATPSWGAANDNKQTTVPILLDTTLTVAGTYYFYAALNNANPNTSVNCQPMAMDSILITGCDWGDLPDTSANTLMSDYQTTAANNGPVHIIIPGLKLGALVDSESNGIPDTLALGDNNDISNDEEGVTIFPSINIVPGGIIRLPLVVMNSTGDTAYIEAWIDWNGDGDFEDANEMVADLKDNHDGVFPASMDIIVPIDALTGSLLGFRIRLSNTDNMTPYGQVNSGEVEDYLLGIDCPQVICLPLNIEIQKKE